MNKEVCFEVESLDLTCKLNINEFENLCKDLFERCIEILEKTINESGLSKEKIDDIVLVGGSSRIPKIQEMIKEYLKKDHLKKNIQPDEAIAIGATIIGQKYKKDELSNENDLVIADVVPLSLGVKIENDLMDILIKKNTRIPCKIKKQFETCSPYQEKVEICVYEGESKNVKNNFFLDKFQLIFKNIKEKNYLPIVFEIDSNDYLLKVYANVLGENN